MNFELIFDLDNHPPGFIIVPSSENIQGRLEKEKVLQLKQELYKLDDNSWYGLTLPIVRYQSITGKHYGIGLSANELIDALMHPNVPLTLSGWFKVVLSTWESELIPTPEGKWIFSGYPGRCPEHIHYLKDQKLHTVPESAVPWEQWITDALINTSTMKEKQKKLLEHLHLYAGHDVIRHWSRQLSEEQLQNETLPLPFYKLARYILMDDNESEVFQLELILHEPAHSSDESWSITGMIHELQTDKRLSLDALFSGENPFGSHITTWLNNQFQIVNQQLPCMDKFCMNIANSVELTSSEAEVFIQVTVPALKKADIEVWLPRSIRSPQTPVVKLSLLMPEEEFRASWGSSNTDWKMILDDQEIEESLLRKFVSEERSLIQLNDSWYMWDLQSAQELIDHVDNTPHPTQSLLFQGLKHEQDEVDEDVHSFQINLNDLFVQLKNITTNQLKPAWKTVLRDYQIEGVQWLLNMRSIKVGALLADDMGLGKTKQVISYFDHIRDQNPQSSFLILCPSSLLHHWEQELSNAFPEQTILIHQGSVSKRRTAFFKAEKSDFIVVSYATVVRDENLFVDETWSAVVYDEAQKIKNIHTHQRKTAGKLTSEHAIALSGTPVENHPDEIWSLLNLLNPGYLGDRESFVKILQNQGMKALKEQIRPVILRRTKGEVQSDLQLPERNIHHHSINLSFEQLSLYKACVEELMDTLEDGTESEQRVRIFKTMMKLKQICNHPAQFKKEAGISRFQPGRSQKWDHAQTLLRTWEKENRKGIIFTQFRYIGQLFQDYHLVHGGTHQIPFLHGGLTASNRKKMIHSFKTDPDIPYIVISLRAGGFGLNLTEASAVLHFDRWWNPAVENQATDRVHRIGQTKDVDVHTLTAKGTIEERINDLILQKEDLQEVLLSSQQLPLWNLEPEQIKKLLTYK